MAATAAKPPSGATSPTTLKPSATWNPSADPPPATAAALATATARPPALSRSSTTPPNLRRAGRQPPSDYLSDKATAAFIRRTLCAQHLADRGRNSPLPIEQLLPPLTSRNDLDLQLYALIAVILREYVQNWYNKITPDETFVAEIVQTIAHCTRALEQRIRKVDLESLLFDELPELLDEHVRGVFVPQPAEGVIGLATPWDSGLLVSRAQHLIYRIFADNSGPNSISYGQGFSSSAPRRD
jgi:hypothetical protein